MAAKSNALLGAVPLVAESSDIDMGSHSVQRANSTNAR